VIGEDEGATDVMGLEDILDDYRGFDDWAGSNRAGAKKRAVRWHTRMQRDLGLTAIRLLQPVICNVYLTSNA
jgi:hypothetical protein